MQSLVESSVAFMALVRHAPSSFTAIQSISFREGRRPFSGFRYSSLLIESRRTFCGGPPPPPHTVKKETQTNNKKRTNNKEEEDDAALLRSFEQWMVKFRKVYRTPAEKSRRFGYFKKALRGIEDYNRRHTAGRCGLTSLSDDSPRERWNRCHALTGGLPRCSRPRLPVDDREP